MNRDKQISEDEQIYEMIDYLSEGARSAMEDAVALYTAGYRKSSDIAREIFEEIDSLLENDENDFDKVFEESGTERDCEVSLALSNYVYAIRKMVAELKKKYTESEKDNG